MNNQEALEKVFRHFIIKKRPGTFGSFNSPSYETCAIGVLLPSKLRAQVTEWESTTYGEIDVVNLLHDFPKAVEILPELSFCTSLEKAHDSLWDDDTINSQKEFRKALKKNLKSLAQKFGLTMPKKPKKTEETEGQHYDVYDY